MSLPLRAAAKANIQQKTTNIRPLKNASAKESEARARSLELDKKPSEKVKPNDLGISNNIANTLNNERPVENKTEYANDNFPSQEQMEDDLDEQQDFQDDNEPNYAESNPDNQNSYDPYDKAVSALKQAGYNFDRKDVKKLRQTKFKVNFPWTSVIISVFNFFSSIIFSLIGMTVFVVGLASDAFGFLTGIFTLGIGLFLGAAVGTMTKVVGIAIWVMSAITSVILAIGQVIAQLYYLRNASIVMRHSHIVKKYATKLGIWRALTILLGWIPLVNGVVSFASSRMLWRLVRKETKIVQDIIEKSFR